MDWEHPCNMGKMQNQKCDFFYWQWNNSYKQ